MTVLLGLRPVKLVVVTEKGVGKFLAILLQYIENEWTKGIWARYRVVLAPCIQL